MENFCKDLNVDPANIVMLVLAYKMGAKKMGYFTQEEWLKGLIALNCDCASKLIQKLGQLTQSLSDPNVLKDVFRYSYDFARVSFIFLFFNSI